MPNIQPISDLRNYSSVLHKVSLGEPVFLTKNGRGRFAILDISEYERMKTTAELMTKLYEGERSAIEKGWLALDDVKADLGVVDV